WFYQNTLFDLAAEWHRYGGELLLIDEVHKYENWSRELKLIYDGHPGLKVIFTSSSALDLYRGESDLSRRLFTQNLHGLSFREYLSLMHGLEFEKVDLDDLVKHPRKLAEAVLSETKPLPLFKKYIRQGYFPFVKDVPAPNLDSRHLQILNTIMESDLAFIQDYSAANIHKVKKLLGVIAASAPFEPNISNIARKLNLGRDTVNQYLKHLHDAHILTLVYKPSKGISHLQKPDKIHFENPVFAYSLQNEPNPGTIRETFFMNQLRNAGHKVSLPPKGDFLIDEKWIFEVGGKNKTSSQVKNESHALLALDEIEVGVGKNIPLWLFGFLY
ncbi:MAG: AAA family ATPase, partial [Balneolales bacterium]